MLKLNIIVTLSMMEAIFATLHKKNTIVIKIKKWQIVLIEGLFRVAIRGIAHQQLLTETPAVFQWFDHQQHCTGVDGLEVVVEMMWDLLCRSISKFHLIL